MNAKRTLHVFDILYSMLLSSVSPSFAPFLRPNVAQTLAEGSFDRYAPLKTLCRPECFASVCFCFDSVAEGKPFEKRAVLVHFAA